MMRPRSLFALALVSGLVFPFGLCAEEYDPTPAELVDDLFKDIEGAVGGKEGKLVGLGGEALKLTSGVTYEREVVIGETIALEAFSKFGRLTQDRQLLEYVSLVGNAVARASARPNTPYYFAVCENPDPNAFAVPGGYIFMTTGLLKLVKNEEELAGVMGHEIAHLALRHAIKTIKKGKFLDVGIKAVGVILGEKPQGEVQPSDRPDYFGLVSDLTKNITEKGFSRGDENHADELGADFAYRAGYRVQGLRDFLGTLVKLEGKQRDMTLFKTYRDTDKRVAELDKLIQKQRYPAQPTNARLAARFEANLRSRLK
jgi:predicted Zn-dependent protease